MRLKYTRPQAILLHVLDDTGTYYLLRIPNMSTKRYYILIYLPPYSLIYEAVIAQVHKRATVNATVVGSISFLGNSMFIVHINMENGVS